MPRMTAKKQMVTPPFDFPTIEITRPNIAKGITIQLSQPNKGINPIIIPIKARIPNSRPNVFIMQFVLCLLYQNAVFGFPVCHGKLRVV